MPEEKTKPSFWTTVPGIITGVAALLGAIAALVTALSGVGMFGLNKKESAKTESVVPAENKPQNTNTSQALVNTPVNRTNPKETAIAILKAYKAKDFDLLYTYLSKGNQETITSPTDWKARQKSILSGWRWDVVSNWNEKIDEVRFRHYVGTEVNQYEANVKFAEISPTEYAVVTLVFENGIWAFDDIHSPEASSFNEGLPVFSTSAEPY